MPHQTVYPLREAPRISGTGSTEEIVRTDQVPEGWLWLLTAFGAEDEDSAATSLRVFIESGGQRYLLAEETSPSAGVLYHDTTFQVLGPGDRVGARWTGSTNGDDLVLYVHGLQLPADSELTPLLLGSLLARR